MFATGLCILDGRSRRVSCCPDVTAVAGWGGLAPRGSRCIPRWEEVGAAPQPNLYLLYVIFMNNYLYKWPPVFGVSCWVRGQGQIRFVYLLGKDVRAGSLPGLDNGDNPSEEHAAEGGDPGGGSGGWCCLQAVFPAGLALAALAGG